MVEKNARIRAYRLWKKMRSAFEVLHAHGRIDDETKGDWFRICDSLYADWRAELREKRKPFRKRPGRPKTVIDRNVLAPTCLKEGCGKPSAEGQVYCSKGCAPLAAFGRGWKKKAEP